MERSLHFYRDLLGFAVTDVATGHAVVEGHGARILLESAGDPAGLPPGTVHLEVSDIETTCAQLQTRGIQLLQSPVATGGGEGAQLWRARLRDPDGHDVELVEWRRH
jgi:catechol 2,3-dioxygenase-like lactoylglutathione lyase family enzyme